MRRGKFLALRSAPPMSTLMPGSRTAVRPQEPAAGVAAAAESAPRVVHLRGRDARVAIARGGGFFRSATKDGLEVAHATAATPPRRCVAAAAEARAVDDRRGPNSWRDAGMRSSRA